MTVMDEAERIKRFNEFPRLETNRLLLRDITMDDAEWYLHHFSTAEIVSGQGFPAPRSLQEAKDEMKTYFVDLFKCRSGFRWGIEMKASPGLIGSCGYYKWQKPEGLQAEMGYDLNPRYWGRGIMTEALSSIIDFGFMRMELNRIEILVMKQNVRSQKLAMKLGFVKEGVLREHGFDENRRIVDDILFSLLKGDWQMARKKATRQR